MFPPVTFRYKSGVLDEILGNEPDFRDETHGTIGPVCISYDLEGARRWACAILPADQAYFYYAGFYHPEDHEAIEHLERGEESLEITAAQVEASQSREVGRKSAGFPQVSETVRTG